MKFCPHVSRPILQFQNNHFFFESATIINFSIKLLIVVNVILKFNLGTKYGVLKSAYSESCARHFDGYWLVIPDCTKGYDQASFRLVLSWVFNAVSACECVHEVIRACRCSIQIAKTWRMSAVLKKLGLW